MYGVKKDLLGLLEGRETYVIGKDGTVKMVRSKLRFWFLVQQHFSNDLKLTQP